MTVNRFGLFLLLATVWISHAPAANLDESTEGLRKKLQTELERAKELQNKKRQLEKALENGQSSLKRFDKILQNYQYNLNQAQKVIDAAQAELHHIDRRNQGREHLFSNCLTGIANYYPGIPVHNPAQNLAGQTVIETIGQITHLVFMDIQSERPRMSELLQIIEEKQALQERIYNQYLPSDMEKKENAERLLDETTQAVEKTDRDSQEIQKHIDALRSQIAAAEAEIQRRIAEQKRLAEQKRRQEEEKRKKQLAAQSAKAPVSNLPGSSANPTATKGSSPSSTAPPPSGNSSFSEQQGLLIWPAQGAIVRSFGEFTHPEYKVKMKSYGINVRVDTNQSIRSVAKGTVFFNGEIAGFGPTVIVDHGQDYVSVYGNVKSSIPLDRAVAGGQEIGKAASVELHFELRKGDVALNPLTWLRPR